MTMKNGYQPRFRMLMLVPILVWFAIGCSSAPPRKPGSDDVKKQAVAYAQSGSKFYNHAQYEEALVYFNLALKENMRIFNEEGMAESWISIGTVERSMGDSGKAEAAFRSAISIAQKIESKILLGKGNNNLAELLLERGKYREALSLFQEAAKAVDEKTDESMYAILTHNIGVSWKNMGEYQKALSSLETALKINTRLTNVAEMGSNYYAIASVYSKLGNYEKAEENAKLALKQDQIAENSAGIAMDLYALGTIREKAGDAVQAYEYYYQSYQVYATIEYRSGIMKMLPILRDTATRAGKAEEAESWKLQLDKLTEKKNEG